VGLAIEIAPTRFLRKRQSKCFGARRKHFPAPKNLVVARFYGFWDTSVTRCVLLQGVAQRFGRHFGVVAVIVVSTGDVFYFLLFLLGLRDPVKRNDFGIDSRELRGFGDFRVTVSSGFGWKSPFWVRIIF